MAGHITARDPERLDHFWVNPFGMHFKQIRVSDLILVNDDGEVVEGDRPVNRAAFAIHSQVHAARPDVVAAAHSHSIYGKAWSSLGRLLDPLTQDACAFYGDHAVFDDYTGVVLDTEEGKRIAHALGDEQGRDPAQPRPAHRRPLGRRGRVVVHHAWSASCQAQLLAEAAGEPVLIDAEMAARHREPGRLARRRLVRLPAALRLDRARAARPARLRRREQAVSLPPATSLRRRKW